MRVLAGLPALRTLDIASGRLSRGSFAWINDHGGVCGGRGNPNSRSSDGRPEVEVCTSEVGNVFTEAERTDPVSVIPDMLGGGTRRTYG